MSVADEYPARREVDTRGERVWFKAAIRDSAETWGWTVDPAQAHPDYQVQIADDGSLVTWVGDPWGGSDTIVLPPVADADLPRISVNGQRVDWTALDNALSEGYVSEDDVKQALGKLCGCRASNWQTEIMDQCSLHRPKITTTPKGSDMTDLAESGIDVAGDEPRFTEWMRYPLPPRPPRFKVIYDGYGRYKLPSPSTGRPTGFSRATTIAKTLEETYNLSRWSRRQAVRAIVNAVDSPTAATSEQFDTAGSDPVADTLAAVREAIKNEDDRKLDAAVDLLDNLTGGADARELGEAVHAWLEAVDTQTVLPAQVPEQFQPYVQAYRAVLAKHGLVAVPEYVERIVLNDQGEETVVGTIDRIYRVVTTGALVLGDVKTSKTLEYSWLAYAVQFAVYGYATKMMAADGSGWESMPELDLDACYCLHVPSNQPERAACVTFDLFWGGTTMVTSLEVRRLRKEAAKAVGSVHAVPVPSKVALRYVEARDALLDIENADQLPAVWESYQDVWTDDLTELGGRVAQLLDAAA